MERDLGDVLDRHSIAKLKAVRIGSEENIRECAAFEKHIVQDRVRSDYDFDTEVFAALLLKLNGFIWDMESALKSGKDNLPEPHYLFASANTNQLAQIGTIAILIRNINSHIFDWFHFLPINHFGNNLWFTNFKFISLTSKRFNKHRQM